MPWAEEFPNDNPDLFSEPPDESIEVIDAFDDAEFAHAITESMLPPTDAPTDEVRAGDLGTSAFGALPSKSRPPAASPPEDFAPASTSHTRLVMNEERYAEIQDEEPSAWNTYIQVMREVALGFGAARDVAQGMALTLEANAVARAWRVVIEGGEADFTACGSAMLDEWSAGFIARLTGAALDPIRRELRRRGVCAFGLIAA